MSSPSAGLSRLRGHESVDAPCGRGRDRSGPALRAAIEGLILAAVPNTGQCAKNRAACDHGRLKARLGPVRELKSAKVRVRDEPRKRDLCRSRCRP